MKLRKMLMILTVASLITGVGIYIYIYNLNTPSEDTLANNENTCAGDSISQGYDNNTNEMQGHACDSILQVVKDYMEEYYQKKLIDKDSIPQAVKDYMEEHYQKKAQTEKDDLSGYISWIPGIIGLFMAVIAMRGAGKYRKELKKYQERLDRHRKDIEGLKSNQSSNFHVPSSHDKPSFQVRDLETRISNLERLSRQKTVPVATPSPKPTEISIPKNKVRKGYFDTPVKGGGTGYFNELVENVEYANFDVEVTDNKAEFKPRLSAKQLCYSDVMKPAVDIDYNGIPKEEATRFSVMEKGKAVLHGDRWIIEKKVVIKLVK
ncbi:MAG: hypothetical protein NC344_02235 [Bacteroidales bacterium]|nr:hypothetical protein [Bacteroidales bacterium]MCM1146651.1 hypothetical protein [Bacteroidales bacterium]MCM1206043.1 hypothetical protein [Bacillota bacterium]MCM1511057.1 hypothetical protein [Clostridium sp.]